MPKLHLTLDTKDWLGTCGSSSGCAASLPRVQLTFPSDDDPSSSLGIFVSGGGSGVTILAEVSSSTAVKCPVQICSDEVQPKRHLVSLTFLACARLFLTSVRYIYTLEEIPENDIEQPIMGEDSPETVLDMEEFTGPPTPLVTDLSLSKRVDSIHLDKPLI